MAVTQIEKLFGKGSIMKLGEKPIEAIPVVSTGSIALDIALGIAASAWTGHEIYGPEASGKTTLALQVVAEIQKQGGTASFIDAEHALDVVYAKRIGVNTTIFSSPRPTQANRRSISPRFL
jgi:recombination protein RecA